MNRLSGAEALVRMLDAHGVRHVFGLCGDTSLPFYDALYRLDHGIEHILTRDERHAAYMADAYARVTGRPGICEGPSGGGATYILPGLVEANESSIPLLAITTDISTTGKGHYVLTELDQQALFRPVTKWNSVIDQASQLPASVRRAFREMTRGRAGSVHLGLPFDVQKAPVDEESIWPDDKAVPKLAPDPAAIERAAASLRDAERPVIVCGGAIHATGARKQLAGLADLLDAPVATTISGKGSLADTHPLSLGVVGSNGGTPETRRLVEQADLVMFIGCRAGSVTTERWRAPVPGKARIVHVDIDPAVPGANYQTDVVVLGDAGLAIEALIAASEPGKSRGWDAKAEVAAAREAKFARFEEIAYGGETPIRPERVVAELQKLLPDDHVIVADPGTPCPYFSAYWRQQTAGRKMFSNRAHGALGYALPAVVGAAVGRPEAKCVAVTGDGSFGMACGELETIRRLGLPVTIIVINNAVFGWIKAGQRSGFGERYFSVDFGESDHAAIARAFGIRARRAEQPGELATVLDEAINFDGPSLVDIVCQPLHEAAAPVSEWVA